MTHKKTIEPDTSVLKIWLSFSCVFNFYETYLVLVEFQPNYRLAHVGAVPINQKQTPGSTRYASQPFDEEFFFDEKCSEFTVFSDLSRFNRLAK